MSNPPLKVREVGRQCRLLDGPHSEAALVCRGDETLKRDDLHRVSFPEMLLQSAARVELAARPSFPPRERRPCACGRRCGFRSRLALHGVTAAIQSRNGARCGTCQRLPPVHFRGGRRPAASVAVRLSVTLGEECTTGGTALCGPPALRRPANIGSRRPVITNRTFGCGTRGPLCVTLSPSTVWDGNNSSNRVPFALRRHSQGDTEQHTTNEPANGRRGTWPNVSGHLRATTRPRLIPPKSIPWSN